jgi:hypothetical protein
MDMDIVIYEERDQPDVRKLGAVQGDGTLAPLSAWTTEPAFDDSLEFLVAEEDRFPGLTAGDVAVLGIVPSRALSYGSRQVGGGKGPGNPHGEESELTYYVDRGCLEGIDIVVKPELEITW